MNSEMEDSGPRCMKRILWGVYVLSCAALVLAALRWGEPWSWPAREPLLPTEASRSSRPDGCRDYTQLAHTLDGGELCVPSFALRLSPPWDEPLTPDELEDFYAAATVDTVGVFKTSGHMRYARLALLGLPWSRDSVDEDDSGKAQDHVLRVVVTALLRIPHTELTFADLEWPGRLNPPWDEPPRWSNWLALRTIYPRPDRPLYESQFHELLAVVLPYLPAVLAELTEIEAPPEEPAEQETAKNEVGWQPIPVPRPTPASAPPLCPPRQSCEAEKKQLAQLTEANLRLANTVEHFAFAPARPSPDATKSVATGVALPNAEAESLVAGEKTSRFQVPGKPYTWQKPPPCDAESDEEAISGGCWVWTGRTAPCRSRTFEHDNKCFRPVLKRPASIPQSEKQEDEEQR